MGPYSSFIPMQSPTMLASVIDSSDTPSFPPSTSLFLPLLSFFQAIQIAIEMHSSYSPIPNLSKHSTFLSFI
jgi:hypothetical protein